MIQLAHTASTMFESLSMPVWSLQCDAPSGAASSQDLEAQAMSILHDLLAELHENSEEMPKLARTANQQWTYHTDTIAEGSIPVDIDFAADPTPANLPSEDMKETFNPFDLPDIQDTEGQFYLPLNVDSLVVDLDDCLTSVRKNGPPKGSFSVVEDGHWPSVVTFPPAWAPRIEGECNSLDILDEAFPVANAIFTAPSCERVCDVHSQVSFLGSISAGLADFHEDHKAGERQGQTHFQRCHDIIEDSSSQASTPSLIYSPVQLLSPLPFETMAHPRALTPGELNPRLLLDMAEWYEDDSMLDKIEKGLWA